MSDAEIDYWRTKYALLERDFQQQKDRNEELEERLLQMVEKIETEKKQLADEIDALTRRLERVSNTMPSPSKGTFAEINEPEDPSMTDTTAAKGLRLSLAPGKDIVLGAREASLHEKGYHHFPVLNFEEGVIYGFRWRKGSAVKIV